MLSSQNSIKLTIKNIKKDSAMIAYYHGEKQYVLGNKNGKNHYIKFNNNGFGEYKSDELKKGMYLLVFPPSNEYVQFLFDGNNLNISLDRNSLQESIRFKNSLSNTLFYQHISFIKKLSEERSEILKNLKKGEDDEEIAEHMSYLDEKYKQFSSNFFNKYSDNVAAKFLKANIEIQIPENYKTHEERFNYYKTNYFKNIDFSSEWLIRTPFFQKKINIYLEKLTSQTPKDIIKSVDYLIDLSTNNTELYQYLVVSFLNKYAKSEMMISESIYAHIAKKYYLSGKATWVEKKQLHKIVENYNNIKNSLLDAKVNDFELISSSGKKSSLYKDNSEYKILYFWESDCSRCNLNESFKTKPQNTKVFSIVLDIDKNQLKDFVKTKKQSFTPNIISEKDKPSVLKQLYLNSYLKVFLLDKNNKIIGKRITIKQAFEIINRIK
jgi:hypothetical protein